MTWDSIRLADEVYTVDSRDEGCRGNSVGVTFY